MTSRGHPTTTRIRLTHWPHPLLPVARRNIQHLYCRALHLASFRRLGTSPTMYHEYTIYIVLIRFSLTVLTQVYKCLYSCYCHWKPRGRQSEAWSLSFGMANESEQTNLIQKRQARGAASSCPKAIRTPRRHSHAYFYKMALILLYPRYRKNKVHQQIFRFHPFASSQRQLWFHLKKISRFLCQDPQNNV